MKKEKYVSKHCGNVSHSFKGISYSYISLFLVVMVLVGTTVSWFTIKDNANINATQNNGISENELEPANILCADVANDTSAGIIQIIETADESPIATPIGAPIISSTTRIVTITRATCNAILISIIRILNVLTDIINAVEYDNHTTDWNYRIYNTCRNM